MGTRMSGAMYVAAMRPVEKVAGAAGGFVLALALPPSQSGAPQRAPDLEAVVEQ